jgi:Tol biopolymer transport system component
MPISVTAAADGKRLTVLKMHEWQDVYVGRLNEDGRSMKPPQRITLDQRGSNLNSWTLDDQILLDSDRNGKREIFRQGPNDKVAETIVSGSADAFGAGMTPDGRWLLYLESGTAGSVSGATPDSLWLTRRPTQGGTAEKVLDLTHVQLNDYGCSRTSSVSAPCVLGLIEGKSVVLYSLDPIRGKGKQLGRIEVVGRFMGWDLSPDGSKVALVDEEKYGPNIEVLSVVDGAWHQIALEPGVGHLQKVAWAADGQNFFVTSIKPGRHSLLRVSMKGKVEPLWHILGQGRSIHDPLASPDGKYLAYNGDTWDSNVWLIDNFEKHMAEPKP